MSRLFETVDVVVDGNGNVKILKDGEIALTLVNKFGAQYPFTFEGRSEYFWNSSRNVSVVGRMVYFVGKDGCVVFFSFDDVKESIKMRKALAEKTSFQEAAHICDDGETVAVLGFDGSVYEFSKPDKRLKVKDTYGQMDWTSIARDKNSVVVAGYKDKAQITYILLDMNTSAVRHSYCIMTNII